MSTEPQAQGEMTLADLRADIAALTRAIKAGRGRDTG